MPTNASPSDDVRQQLDATIGALEGGVTALSPTAARATIERWLNTLADHDDLNDVASALGELRAELAATPIDGDAVGRILGRLGTRTTEAADMTEDDATATKLQRLGGLLTRAGGVLLQGGPPSPETGTAEEAGVVQEHSTPKGPMPQGPDRADADVEGVNPNAASETPGTKLDPQ
jgi:hypothetical protein